MADLHEVSKGFREEESDQLKKLVEYVHGIDASAIKTMDYSEILKIERKIHDRIDIIDKCKECMRFTINLDCARNEKDVVKKMSGAFYYE